MKIFSVTPDKENDHIWTIQTDGFFSSKIKEVMNNEDYSEESVSIMFQNVIKILSQCPNPIKKEKNGKTGIIIGKVQSGKTSNFIALMGLAFDNNFEICIVLGGTKKSLVDQNIARIKNFFEFVKPEELVILDTNKNKDLLNSKEILAFIKQKRKIVIIGLKHKKHITEIANIFINDQLSNIPTIIIDDEGDQATLNTKKYSKDSKKEMSIIYESVLNLKSKLNIHCFISITATPQANILIDTFDLLSPDFGYLVKPSEGYCGLAEFHGEEQDKFIKVIPENEHGILDGEGVPRTLYEALSAFFVSNGIRKYRGDFGNHALLFHPSQRKYDHTSVMEKIQSILDNWKHKAENKEDISYEELKKHLIKSYNSYVSDGVIVPNFIDLEFFVIKSILNCSNVHLCNSDTDASENSKLFSTNIFIGGNMVERGLTIKGLAITYIIRRAKTKSNIDNTEQRARWFGYKKDYLDICRVFTTKQIKYDFHTIYEHDEALWYTIEKAEQQGTVFKEIGRVFKNNNKLLQLTRSNVAKTKILNFYQFKTQNKVILNESIANKNNLLLETIKKYWKNDLHSKSYNNTQKHLFLKDLKFSYVKKELFDKYEYHVYENLLKLYFNPLQRGFELINEDPETDIVWVRYETNEERDINVDGTIQSTLMQGYNHNYIGDRKLPDDRPDKIQIQVHLVKPKKLSDVNYYSPCFVIYLPVSLTSRLCNLVTWGEE